MAHIPPVEVILSSLEYRRLANPRSPRCGLVEAPTRAAPATRHGNEVFPLEPRGQRLNLFPLETNPVSAVPKT
jgi:hypothetical protein